MATAYSKHVPMMSPFVVVQIRDRRRKVKVMES